MSNWQFLDLFSNEMVSFNEELLSEIKKSNISNDMQTFFVCFKAKDTKVQDSAFL